MTPAAKRLLKRLDELSEQDREEVVVEFLRRVALAPHDLPPDKDLIAAAGRLFGELDRRERS